MVIVVILVIAALVFTGKLKAPSAKGPQRTVGTPTGKSGTPCTIASTVYQLLRPGGKFAGLIPSTPLLNKSKAGTGGGPAAGFGGGSGAPTSIPRPQGIQSGAMPMTSVCKGTCGNRTCGNVCNNPCSACYGAIIRQPSSFCGQCSVSRGCFPGGQCSLSCAGTPPPQPCLGYGPVPGYCVASVSCGACGSLCATGCGGSSSCCII